MRLYRGLKNPYRPELVGAGQGSIFGTDFTDCPFTALRYAAGSRGTVIWWMCLTMTPAPGVRGVVARVGSQAAYGLGKVR